MKVLRAAPSLAEEKVATEKLAKKTSTWGKIRGRKERRGNNANSVYYIYKNLTYD